MPGSSVSLGLDDALPPDPVVEAPAPAEAMVIRDNDGGIHGNAAESYLEDDEPGLTNEEEASAREIFTS